MTGFEHDDFDLPTTAVAWDALTQLRWPTSATGVPIGFNRTRETVYLGLASPEPVRITVTGTGQFHVGIVARLALSGLPVAVYTADPRQWAHWPTMVRHSNSRFARVTPLPGSIVVTDGSIEAPARCDHGDASSAAVCSGSVDDDRHHPGRRDGRTCFTSPPPTVVSG